MIKTICTTTILFLNINKLQLLVIQLKTNFKMTQKAKTKTLFSSPSFTSPRCTSPVSVLLIQSSQLFTICQYPDPPLMSNVVFPK